jgi:iron complex outermembrane recepter protein
MKITTYIFFIIFYFSVPGTIFALPEKPDTVSLAGRILEKSTGLPLTGVNIYFPELKTGTVSNISGYYRIGNLPRSPLLVQVSFVGYMLIAEKIDLSELQTKDFLLEEAATELSEVVVTGTSSAIEREKLPVQLAIVPYIQLLQGTSTNITDAIATLPGIAQVTTGPGISKPVIRGLGYNRVLVLTDGVRQEGQQWGDEHGLELDENSVDRIEIIKGPASLSYGSDAMAGVINLLPAHPLPPGKTEGSIRMNYQSNNGLSALSAKLAGNNKGFIWELQSSLKGAHAYKNSVDGYVYNSGYHDKAAEFKIGLNRSWGYSHFSLSLYELEPGIIEGERDSLTGRYTKAEVVGDHMLNSLATTSDFHSYRNEIPSQKIDHYKFIWNSAVMSGKNSMKMILGFQQNHRQEFGDIMAPGVAGLDLVLNTLSYDLEYQVSGSKDGSLSFGVNGMYQHSANMGSEYLIPEYKLFDAGFFSMFNKSLGKFEISGGLRFDLRQENSDPLVLDSLGEVVRIAGTGDLTRFNPINRYFSGISGSMGTAYPITDKLQLKLNLSRGYRAPNIFELAANGLHEGTFRYEKGNAALKPETSLQTDLALEWNSHHLSAYLSLFDNQVQHYILSERTDEGFNEDSLQEGYSMFTFEQGKARLMGGEISFDLHPHPLDWLHIENSFSWVNGYRPSMADTMRYLPMLPPAKLSTGIRADLDKGFGSLKKIYLEFGAEHYFRQDHFFAAWGTETASSAYTLINLSMGAELYYKGRSRASVFLAGRNLADIAWQSHLSRLKYAPVNYHTGRTGVFDMGRNFSIKLVVPFGN